MKIPARIKQEACERRVARGQVSPENFGEAEARNAVPITRVIFHDSMAVCLLLDPNKLSRMIWELKKVEQNCEIIVFLIQKTPPYLHSRNSVVKVWACGLKLPCIKGPISLKSLNLFHTSLAV